MSFDSYTDSLGYTIEVGTVVGITENFLDSEFLPEPDMSEKTYVVTKFINCGDMVEIQACELDNEGNPTNQYGSPIAIQPYKIGAV